MRFASAVGVDNVQFYRPIPQGSIALLDAYVYEAGGSKRTVETEEGKHLRVDALDE